MDTLDLQADYERIYSFLKARIEHYAHAKNNGPGASGDPITLITFGYDYTHLGWVALVFDTRQEAEPDGEWTTFIEGEDESDSSLDERTTIPMPHWHKILGVDYESDDFDEDDDSYPPVQIKLRDESLLILDEYGDEELSVLGDLMRDALLQAREEGLLAQLPLAETCSLSVEHFDGYYGWPDYDDRLSVGNAKLA